MQSAKILLVGDDEQAKKVLLKPFEDAGQPIKVAHHLVIDDALQDLVIGNFQLCVVFDDEANPEFSLTICKDTREAGIRTPIIVLMKHHDAEREKNLIDAGGYITSLGDTAEKAMLKNLVHLTVDLHRTEETLRKSNDRLMMEMRTLQDERERAELRNAEYIELMENYALAMNELEKINQEKNKFFSIIAHDLRSPFTGLIGFASLLKEGAETYPTEKIKHFADHIYKSSTSIFKLLENLLEWSRLQMNRVTIVHSVFILSNVSQKTMNVLMPVAAEKEIKLIESSERFEVYADANMIDAVIRNLISNAIKFTPRGGTITLSYETDKAKNTATVHIQDTGIGMTEATVQKLFHIAENVSTSGTDGEEGTGLGLLLCAELIERNNGAITVKSEKGKGSTFSFTLPLSAPEDENDEPFSA